MNKGWSVASLAELCEFQRGLTYSKSDETSMSSNIVLRANNINVNTNNLDFGDVRYIADSVKVSANKKVRKDSILICTASGSKSHLGKIAYINKDYDYAFGGFMGQITATDKLYPRYLYYALTSPKYKEFISKLSDGVNINNLKFDDLKYFEISYPSLPEQQRIVTILDEAFEAIATARANAEKNLQNARALFDSYLHSIDAEKISLGSLVNITTGKLDANAAVENGPYAFFTCSRDIYAIDKFAFDCEAILLAGNNAVGDFNVKHYSGKFNAYQRTYVITVNNQNRILYRFLYFQLLNSLKTFKEQSVGAGTKFLKLGMIKDLQISFPSLEEQQSIVTTLDSLNEKIQALELIYQQKIAALDELKKSLLHQAFSGELCASRAITDSSPEVCLKPRSASTLVHCQAS